MNKAQLPKTKHLYRKPAKLLFVIALLLAGLGAFLYFTADQEAMASALVALLPGALALIIALSLFWWDGKDPGDGGSVAPGPM